jgi:hypothetical protein
MVEPMMVVNRMVVPLKVDVKDVAHQEADFSVETMAHHAEVQAHQETVTNQKSFEILFFITFLRKIIPAGYYSGDRGDRGDRRDDRGDRAPQDNGLDGGDRDNRQGGGQNRGNPSRRRNYRRSGNSNGGEKVNDN